MLAEHDQLRAGDWLSTIQLLKQQIRWRTTRTAFGSEKLN
jgi:hypothetical protein